MADNLPQSAEATYRTVSDDLRFADAKALFVALLIGAWINAIFNAVGFKDLQWSLLGARLKVVLILFALISCLSLFSALTAIFPRMPAKREKSVHQLQELAGRSAGELTELFESANYQKSLLDDLGRVAKRCVQKYFWVKVSACLGVGSLLCGAALLYCKIAP